MAIVGPHGPSGLVAIGVLALVVAFASATQDIAVDAWRIEAANDSDELGLFTSVFQLGYRIALLVTDALILVFAQHFGWPLSYVAMALFMPWACSRRCVRPSLRALTRRWTRVRKRRCGRRVDLSML